MDQKAPRAQRAHEADPTAEVDRAAKTSVRPGRRWGLAVGIGVLTCAVVIGLTLNSRQGANYRAPSGATHDADHAQTALHGAPGPIAATMRSDAVLKHFYPMIADLLDSPVTDVIVLGTVRDVIFGSSEGLATTTLKVDVTRNLRGSTSNAITVHEDGGYLPVSDVLAELKEKAPTAVLSADPTSYVDVLFEGAPHPRVGERVMLVLHKDPNPGHEGDYMEVSSVYGRFTLITTDAYQRAGDDSTDFQTVISLPEVLSHLRTPR